MTQKITSPTRQKTTNRRNNTINRTVVVYHPERLTTVQIHALHGYPRNLLLAAPAGQN